METIKAICSENDYEVALARVWELMGILSTPEGEIQNDNHPARIELETLTNLVEHYEDWHYPIGPPSPIAAIEFEMDQRELTQRDLVPLIGSGSRAKVSEVLSGKRPITMSMARALHRHLGISADVLLQHSDTDLNDSLSDIDWRRFPLKAMAKQGWIPDASDLRDRAEEIMRDLIGRAGGSKVAESYLFRKNDHRRMNAKTDPYALRAWCWQVLAFANSDPQEESYQPGAVTPALLREVAQLSTSENGPRQAVDLLARYGVPVKIVPHLPRTHLDGAALRLGDGRPVIGLTLRYDRIDNFWFCLLHELAHVGLHLDTDEDEIFVHDHSLRNNEGYAGSVQETEADEWAEEALIPKAAWDEREAAWNPSGMAVIALALDLGIHPAIVAGRVRYETGNYRLLSQFVGTGQVRRQFESTVTRTD